MNRNDTNGENLRDDSEGEDERQNVNYSEEDLEGEAGSEDEVVITPSTEDRDEEDVSFVEVVAGLGLLAYDGVRDSAKFAGRQISSGGRFVGRKVSKVGSRYMNMPLRGQVILLAAGVVGTVIGGRYLLSEREEISEESLERDIAEVEIVEEGGPYVMVDERDVKIDSLQTRVDSVEAVNERLIQDNLGYQNELDGAKAIYGDKLSLLKVKYEKAERGRLDSARVIDRMRKETPSKVDLFAENGLSPNLDYIVEGNYLGSEAKEDARDIDGYRLKNILEANFTDGNLIERVLSGESGLAIMNMGEASKYDPSVFEEGTYALETDSNGEVREGALADNLGDYTMGDGK